MKVHTAKGEIDREKLVAKDMVIENEEARVTATEWYHVGELVRRDVWVNPLRVPAVGVKNGQ